MACANSCANVEAFSSFDESGLRESEFGIYAAGTFRIEGEGDEGKQPMFNLATINCEKQPDDMGKVSLECKVTRAVVWARSGKPDPDNPNCSLDLDSSARSAGGDKGDERNNRNKSAPSAGLFHIARKRIFNEGASERRSYRDRDHLYCLLQHDTDNRSKYENGIYVVHKNGIRRQLR